MSDPKVTQITFLANNEVKILLLEQLYSHHICHVDSGTKTVTAYNSQGIIVAHIENVICYVQLEAGT